MVNRILFSHIKDCIAATIGINLKNIILSERSHTHMIIYSMIPYMWDSLWITGKSKETESRLIGAGVGKRKEWGLII